MICYRLTLLILLLLLQLDIRLTTSNLYYHPADPDIGPIDITLWDPILLMISDFKEVLKIFPHRFSDTVEIVSTDQTYATHNEAQK